MKTMIRIGLAAAASLALSAGLAAAGDPAAEAMMKKSDCFTCHQVKMKVVGPSFKDIAKKYSKDKKAVPALAKKVKAGGQGVWGQVPMAPHASLKDEEATAMVKWVLAQK